LVAQRIGAGDAADARHLSWHGLLIGVGCATLLGAAVYLLRGSIVALYTHDTVIAAAAFPLLAWVVLFHIADAAQTVAAFVLRAYRIATVPLVIYAVAIWGVGLGGGYALAFDASGVVPDALHGAPGFWAAATVGLMLAGAGMSAFLAWMLRRQRAHEREAVPEPAATAVVSSRRAPN
jgi:MATE family multidrug resistance protein